MLEEIQMFIDEEINPMLASHGGGCSVVAFSEGVLKLKFEGGCAGCPSRRATFLNAVRPVLMQRYPDDIKEIVLEQICITVNLGLKKGNLELYDYSNDYPAIFEKEKKELLDIYKDRIKSIEHIGSTSIIGLKSKPIIDIVIQLISSFLYSSCHEKPCS